MSVLSQRDVTSFFNQWESPFLDSRLFASDDGIDVGFSNSLLHSVQNGTFNGGTEYRENVSVKRNLNCQDHAVVDENEIGDTGTLMSKTMCCRTRKSRTSYRESPITRSSSCFKLLAHFVGCKLKRRIQSTDQLGYHCDTDKSTHSPKTSDDTLITPYPNHSNGCQFSTCLLEKPITPTLAVSVGALSSTTNVCGDIDKSRSVFGSLSLQGDDGENVETETSSVDVTNREKNLTSFKSIEVAEVKVDDTKTTDAPPLALLSHSKSVIEDNKMVDPPKYIALSLMASGYEHCYYSRRSLFHNEAFVQAPSSLGDTSPVLDNAEVGDVRLSIDMEKSEKGLLPKSERYRTVAVRLMSEHVDEPILCNADMKISDFGGAVLSSVESSQRCGFFTSDGMLSEVHNSDVLVQSRDFVLEDPQHYKELDAGTGNQRLNVCRSSSITPNDVSQSNNFYEATTANKEFGTDEENLFNDLVSAIGPIGFYLKELIQSLEKDFRCIPIPKSADETAIKLIRSSISEVKRMLIEKLRYNNILDSQKLANPRTSTCRSGGNNGNWNFNGNCDAGWNDLDVEELRDLVETRVDGIRALFI